MHIIQSSLFDFDVFMARGRNDRLVMVLEALPAEALIAALEREHWTGRKGYSIRGMWSALVAGMLHQCHSLADVIRLLERDKDTRLVCGSSQDNIPSQDALGRFLKRLVEHADLLEKCFADLVKEVRQLLPGFGTNLAVDSTDIKAYSNGHHQNPSDKDARWGAKGAGHQSGPAKSDKRRDLYYWFGYPDKSGHLVLDALYELPVSFKLTAANEADTTQMETLRKKAGADQKETKPEVVIADKGYARQDNYQFIYGQCRSSPIIPIREREDTQLPDICNAKGTPLCSCGLEMVHWGRDGKYLKERCPHVIERVNSRVKELLGLGKITVRGMGKVTVRAVLSLLVMLAAGVGMARRHRLKEIRVLVT